MSQVPNAAIVEKKKAWRSELKRRLRTLSYDRAEIANALFRNLCSLQCFREAKTIGTYVDFKTEAPTQETLPKYFEHNELRVEQVAVPYCVGTSMKFHRLVKPTYDASSKVVFTDLAPSEPFGILEPTQRYRDDESYYVAPNAIDVLIVPGLGFDLSGRRLGRGAGYYDRYLPLLRPGVPLIGYSFEEQLIDEIPTDAFDRPVSAIVTPRRAIEIFAR